MPDKESAPGVRPPADRPLHRDLNDSRPSVRFSLRTMAAVVTGFCVLLGVSAAAGPGLFITVVASIVMFILQVWLPVAIVVVAVYSRGYVQTFFIGISLAILAHRLNPSDVLASRMYQRLDLTTLVGAAVGLFSYVAAGVLAVIARRFVERQGWDRW